MRAQAVLVRQIDLGDHGEYITEAVEIKPDETVEELVLRMLTTPSNYSPGVPKEEYQWRLELRIMRPAS